MKKKFLLKKVISILKKKGLSKNHSKISANYLIEAELFEAKSHGITRLKMYCDRIKKGLIKTKPKIKIKKINSSVSYIDADNCIGFVAAEIGIDKAIQNAKKTGIGLVAVKKSGHYGLSRFYAERAVKKKIDSILFHKCTAGISTLWITKTFIRNQSNLFWFSNR